VNGNPRPKNLLIALAFVLLATLPWIGSRLGLGTDAAVTAPAATRPAVDPEGDAPSRPSRSSRLERPSAAPGNRIAPLRLADLDRAPRPSTPGRDPWRFVDPPRRPAPLLSAKPAKSKAPAPEAEPLAIVADSPAQPPAFPLTYLGHFGPPDKQLAVFTNGQVVFNQQEGDVIDHRFLLTHIGHESVDIRFVGFPDTPPKRIGVTSRRPGGVRGNPG
jgi:hypothetical protein